MGVLGGMAFLIISRAKPPREKDAVHSPRPVAWIEEQLEAQAFGQGYQLPGKSIIARLVTGAKPKGHQGSQSRNLMPSASDPSGLLGRVQHEIVNDFAANAIGFVLRIEYKLRLNRRGDVVAEVLVVREVQLGGDQLVPFRNDFDVQVRRPPGVPSRSGDQLTAGAICGIWYGAGWTVRIS